MTDDRFHRLAGHEQRIPFIIYTIIRDVNDGMGATINQMTNKDMAAFKVIWPALEEEQAAIAAVLSDMDADIATLEAKLAKARAIKLGMMQELLTGRIRLVRNSTSSTGNA